MACARLCLANSINFARDMSAFPVPQAGDTLSPEIYVIGFSTDPDQFILIRPLYWTPPLNTTKSPAANEVPDGTLVAFASPGQCCQGVAVEVPLFVLAPPTKST